LPSAGHQGHISDIQNIGAHGHYLWLTWPPETAYKQNKEQITGGMQLFYCGCSNSWHMHVPFSDDRQHKTRLSSNTMHKLVFSQTNYAKKASRNNIEFKPLTGKKPPDRQLYVQRLPAMQPGTPFVPLLLSCRGQAGGRWCWR